MSNHSYIIQEARLWRAKERALPYKCRTNIQPNRVIIRKRAAAAAIINTSITIITTTAAPAATSTSITTITTTAAPAATSTSTHHHHDDGCACGHEHSHGQERHRTSAHGIKRVYTLQNLGCAHCAAEMQRQISQLDGVDDCVLVYETKQLLRDRQKSRRSAAAHPRNLPIHRKRDTGYRFRG